MEKLVVKFKQMAKENGKRNFLPGVLIVIGIFILIRNWWIGVYAMNPWHMGFYHNRFWTFWPLILVVIGLLIAIRHSSSPPEKEK
jgi:Mg2+ and Co2+ transporter CorA